MTDTGPARPSGRRRVLASAMAALLSLAPAGLRAETLIELLKQPGHVAFMRHALAPIVEGAAPVESGASAETLGPCETQRNLNDKGRTGARRIGETFRSEGVVFEQVYTSKWCRCRETAELIMGRPVENLALINSYYSAPDKVVKGPAQIAALKRYLNEDLAPSARALMVTHGSLIHDLAGFWTDETEIVVFKADGKGGLVMVGRGVP